MESAGTRSRRLHRPFAPMSPGANVAAMLGWVATIVGLVVVVTANVLVGAAIVIVGSVVMGTMAWISLSRVRARANAHREAAA